MNMPQAHPSPLWPRLILLTCLLALMALIVSLLIRHQTDQGNEVERARELLDHGRPDLALAALSRIKEDGAGGPEGLTLAGRALLESGRIAQARRALERSLSLKLDQPDAAKLLASIYLASGDGQRGLVMLRKAAELEPNDFRPWYAMGKVYHDLGNLTESGEAYTQALQRSPPPVEAKESRIGRVRALLDGRHAASASADLEALLEAAPADSRILSLAARHANDLGRTDEARKFADRALAVEPAEFEALLVRSRLAFLAHEPQRAIEDLEKALTLRPYDVATIQLLLQAQQSLGLSEQAAATQQRADRARARVAEMDRLTREIARRPEDPEPRWRMGQAAMEGEMYTLAYQCFRAALDLDPRFQPARDSLERLRSTKGFDYQAAARLDLQASPATRSRPR
jgi:tetratricopeptide (TPR) repeat protein